MNTNNTNDSALSASLAGESRQNLEAIYSDMHKDAYGIRPRAEWTNSSDAELIADMEYFGKIIDRALVEEAAAEKRAIEALEARLTSYMEMGAPDRATAMRWELESELESWGESIKVSSDAQYDIGYYCFCTGLPYSHEPAIREWIGA